MLDEYNEAGCQVMRVRLKVGNWESLQPLSVPLRFAVFVIEQKVPSDLELDEFDAVCLHAVALADDGSTVGTGRLLPDGHIGRLAVRADARGSGVGSALLVELIAQAQSRGQSETILNAQTHAIAFYQRHGYEVSSRPFDDAGIAHVEMRRSGTTAATRIQPSGSSERD